MSTEKLIKSIKRKAVKLDEKMPDFLKHSGEYIIFDGANHLFSDTFAHAVDTGEKIYGSNTAFIVRKIGVAPSLSSLIKK